ncbi:MAPEG family protein [Candidatus Binatia bacterium]|nr:MAPEG family protein [Candidatus Binatia bacterium]
MSSVAVVALLALIEYMVFSLLTGRARLTYNVPAPATTGDPTFERYYRVQQNTVEQLVVFVPALFLFAQYASASLATLLGLVFIVGRALYARGYIAAADKRGPGFAISFIANAVLVLGALFGALFA